MTPEEKQIVDALRYRQWEDPWARWHHEKQPSPHHGRWLLLFNGVEFAGVSEEYRSDHWTGHYAWFVHSRLNQFPSSVEEGKLWLELMFEAWMETAATAMSEKRQRTGAVQDARAK